MNKQRGYYNFDFTAIFIALIVFGVVIGWGGSKLINYLGDHIHVEWHSN